MKILITALLLIVLIATPALANNYFYEMSVQVDGDFVFKNTLNMPEVQSNTELEGKGKAKIALKIIVQDVRDLADWWNLF